MLRLRLCCLIAAVVLCTSYVQSQEEKFAGNLVREEGTSSDRTDPAAGRNLTEGANEAVVVPSSNDQQESGGGKPPSSVPKKVPKKAPRPVGKPESVGFVPPPEEQKEEEVVDATAEKEKLVVTAIPTLPPSIIKPGRMANGSWYIVLYASWCSYSQDALTEFVPTIQYVVDHNISDLVVGKIDIIKHSEVAKHFRVKSTPTIFFFKNGVRYMFDHPVVSTANLIEFMMDILNAEVSNVSSSNELAALRKNHSVIFLIVHDEEIDEDWHRIFLKQANDKALKAKFAFTTNPSIMEDYEFETLPTIIVLKDNTAYQFKETLAAHALSKWILIEKDVAFPTVNESTLRRYVHPVSGQRLGFLAVSKDPSHRTAHEKRAIEELRTLALGRTLLKKYQFGLVEGAAIPEMFARRSFSSFPFFFAFEPYTGYYYLFEPGGKRGSISKDTVRTFLQGINSGEEERLGGVTYSDQIQHVYQLGYGVVQSMIVHRPFLSMLAAFCVTGVVCFYMVVCWQNYTSKPSAAETRTRKAARARRKKEELAKKAEEAARKRVEAKEMAVAKSREGMKLKKRGTGNSEPVVQNGINGASASSASEGTGDSDINSASGEESPSEEQRE